MADSLAALLAASDAADTMWAAFVRHGDGVLELHGWDGTAQVVFDRMKSRRLFRDYLLADVDFACSEAAACGLDVLQPCSRCELVLAAA